MLRSPRGSARVTCDPMPRRMLPNHSTACCCSMPFTIQIHKNMNKSVTHAASRRSAHNPSLCASSPRFCRDRHRCHACSPLNHSHRGW
jgi:hypothetical protein